MLRFVILGALVAVVSAQQFQPQPTGRILEPPVPPLCAQSNIPIDRYFYLKDRQQLISFLKVLVLIDCINRPIKRQHFWKE